MKAAIVGVGAALPSHVIANAALAERLDTTDEWIVRRTGIHERRWLNGSLTLGDLATEACALALADAQIEPSEVDNVMVCTITADRVTPGIAPVVAHALGLGEIAAWDVNAACAGFVYSLDHAAALVESGRARTVLVCGAEALSRLTNMDDRTTAILFGDGAGAVVVAAADVPRGFASFELGSDGSQADLLYADNDDRVLRMAGQEVFRHAVVRMVAAVRRALERAGVAASDLDLLVAHQANARILEAVATDLGVSQDRVVLNVDRYANTSSASIPLALWDAQRAGRLGPGALVGLVAFGAGFVWGAGVVTWKEPERVRA